MDDLPDVLDHMGKTPREFGALHAHLESISAEGSTGAATMLFQAAFNPMPPLTGQIRFVSAAPDGTQREHGLYALPELPGGVVLKMRYRLKQLQNVEEVTALVEAAPPPPNAERVRPAWKLHDTFEIPKLSDMEPSNDDPEFALGMGRRMFRSRNSLIRAEEEVRKIATKRHKARELPKGLAAKVTLEKGSVPESEERTELWRPGAPLPAAEPLVIAKPQTQEAKLTRVRCISCGFEGEGPEYERMRTCPRCDAFW